MIKVNGDTIDLNGLVEGEIEQVADYFKAYKRPTVKCEDIEIINCPLWLMDKMLQWAEVENKACAFRSIIVRPSSDRLAANPLAANPLAANPLAANPLAANKIFIETDNYLITENSAAVVKGYDVDLGVIAEGHGVGLTVLETIGTDNMVVNGKTCAVVRYIIKAVRVK